VQFLPPNDDFLAVGIETSTVGFAACDATVLRFCLSHVPGDMCARVCELIKILSITRLPSAWYDIGVYSLMVGINTFVTWPGDMKERIVHKLYLFQN
jgi:hypothetical protein